MSVPLIDPRTHWDRSPEDFNEWRANNDLPLLYDFFSVRLPGFKDWAETFGIESAIFCRANSTGQLFVGEDDRLLVQVQDHTKPLRFLVVNASPENLERSYRLNKLGVPYFKTFKPYFLWARRTLGNDRFFDAGGNARADTFVYNGWSAYNLPPFSRARLLQTFDVLKLGGVELGENAQIGGRNLDFADLDHLSVHGDNAWLSANVLPFFFLSQS